MLVRGMVLMLVLAMYTVDADRQMENRRWVSSPTPETDSNRITPTSIIIMKESRPTIPLKRGRAWPRVRHVDIILCIWRLETEQPTHWLVVIMCPCTPVFDC
jgi:hypothetical protein